MSIRYRPLLLSLPLLLGGAAGPGAAPSASAPAPSPAGGSAPVPAHAAAALILPASGSLGQLILPPLGPVGAGRTTVWLSSSDPKSVPAPFAVDLPAGTNSITFPLGGLPVSEPTRVTLTAATPFGPSTATTELLPYGLQVPPVLSSAPIELLANGGFGAPAVPAGQDSLVLRGSGDLPGWRLLRGAVELVPSLPPHGLTAWPAGPEGTRQSLDLAGAGAIEQRFPTEAGRTYLFSGWLSHTARVREGRVWVLLDGEPYVQLDHAEAVYGTVTPADRRWAPFSCPFRATGPATTLTLADITGLADGAGAVLDGLSVTSVDSDGPPLVPPPPLGLSPQAVASTEVSLTWVNPSSERTALDLWRRGGGSDWARIAALASDTTTFTDRGLTPATVYSYRARSINRTVASIWSNEITLDTQP